MGTETSQVGAPRLQLGFNRAESQGNNRNHGEK
jgi:hypothetical protein